MVLENIPGIGKRGGLEESPVSLEDLKSLEALGSWKIVWNRRKGVLKNQVMMVIRCAEEQPRKRIHAH